jgi:hypothetical protein
MQHMEPPMPQVMTKGQAHSNVIEVDVDDRVPPLPSIDKAKWKESVHRTQKQLEQVD